MREQALRRSSSCAKEVDAARLKLQEAQEDLDSTRANLVAAEKAAADAEKALHRSVCLIACAVPHRPAPTCIAHCLRMRVQQPVINKRCPLIPHESTATNVHVPLASSFSLVGLRAAAATGQHGHSGTGRRTVI